MRFGGPAAAETGRSGVARSAPLALRQAFAVFRGLSSGIRGRVLTLDISTLHEDLTLGLGSVESSPPNESPTSGRLSTYGLKAALQTQRVGT